jgi:TonB family protein
VSFRALEGWLTTSLLAMLVCLSVVKLSHGFVPQPEGEITRKVKTRVSPVYPDIARRMGISGVVKLVVVVLPNGSVKSTKVLGGHPVLVNAAEDAVKKWKFEPGSEENSGVVEIIFKSESQ